MSWYQGLFTILFAFISGECLSDGELYKAILDLILSVAIFVVYEKIKHQDANS